MSDLTDCNFKSDDNGFAHISGTLGEILKEGQRRAELRPRLEAEMGRILTDEEFIEIAEQTGVRL